jgi:hypothetical protein
MGITTDSARFAVGAWVGMFVSAGEQQTDSLVRALPPALPW